MLAAGRNSRDTPPPGLPLPDSLGCSWKEIVNPVEPFLLAVAAQLEAQIADFDPEVAEYAEFALTNQGKQIRPVLVALSAQAAGNLNDQHVVAAVIIEMIHLATLVHDDVMDEAKIRRRRPTLAAQWGNEISVLVGDCLFAHALKLAASFPTTDVCRATSAATQTVCSGEILQTRQRKRFNLPRSEYFRVIRMKTAELFALACQFGASLAAAPELVQAALRDYGTILGVAYQIYDDCLDLFGSEHLAGKSLGTDLSQGKITLPLLIGLEKADPAARRHCVERIRDWDEGSLRDVLEFLALHQSAEESSLIIFEHLEEARLVLQTVPDSPASQALQALTFFLQAQTEALKNSR